MMWRRRGTEIERYRSCVTSIKQIIRLKKSRLHGISRRTNRKGYITAKHYWHNQWHKCSDPPSDSVVELDQLLWELTKKQTKQKNKKTKKKKRETKTMSRNIMQLKFLKKKKKNAYRCEILPSRTTDSESRPQVRFILPNVRYFVTEKKRLALNELGREKIQRQTSCWCM